MGRLTRTMPLLSSRRSHHVIVRRHVFPKPHSASRSPSLSRSSPTKTTSTRLTRTSHLETRAHVPARTGIDRVFEKGVGEVARVVIGAADPEMQDAAMVKCVRVPPAHSQSEHPRLTALPSQPMLASRNSQVLRPRHDLLPPTEHQRARGGLARRAPHDPRVSTGTASSRPCACPWTSLMLSHRDIFEEFEADASPSRASTLGGVPNGIL